MKVVSVLLVGFLVVAVGLSRSEIGRSHPDEEPDTRAAAELTAPPEARAHPGIGSLVDAVRHGGSWYLLDGTQTRVHIVRADDHLGDFPVGGTAGEEVGRPQVVLAHADTIVVIERRGGLMHLHSSDGTLLTQRRLSIPGCPNPGIFDGISRPEGIVALAICPGARLNTRAFAALEAGAGESRILASTAARPRPDADVDPYFTPILVAHPEGIAFGNAGDDCLVVADARGVVVDSVCHRTLERLPSPEPERSAIARLGVVARALGARLATAETLPPFDRAYPDGGEGYLYRVPTGDGTHARALVSPAGQAVTDRPAPPASRIFVAPGEALFGWLGDGEVHIARYRLSGESG